ncbi:hypothetical protein GALL_301270 [mine drainage metagenome]|uniref:TIGR02678 family protein n=1 Tax=mine drainage metagenome TaxID=410659 RepID=A0A1J5REB8_9ZZZZ
MTNLQNQLALAEREETARAIRLLLRRPLVTRAAAQEDYELVRRRRVAVSRWFESYLGWTLELHPRSGHVRLLKVAPPSLVTEDERPARSARSGVPFDRRRYVFLCVVAAELVRRRVVALGELADAVVHACGTDTELAPFETGRHAHRKAFVDALMFLEGTGALRSIEGRTESFTDDQRTSVLYEVEPAVLFSLLAAPVGASQVEVDTSQDARVDDAVDGLLEEPTYGTGYRELTDPARDRPSPPNLDDGAATARRNLWLRHSALRAAFDDPALHRDHLSAAQRDYLDSISGREQLRKAAEIAGLVLETRAEGYLLIDPDRIATDEQFPTDGASSVAALHLLTILTREPEQAFTLEHLHDAVAALLAGNRGWARTYQDDEGPGRLLTESLALLGRHHLVSRADGRVVARPAAQRYRGATIEATTRTGARPRTSGASNPTADAARAVALFDMSDGGVA